MKNILGNSFIINQEVNIIGKKTEVKTKGKSWPDISLNNNAEPVNIPAIVSAALGALPVCSGAKKIYHQRLWRLWEQLVQPEPYR